MIGHMLFSTSLFRLLLVHCPICDDLAIVSEQQSWVITLYAVTFASSFASWGRVSDILSPKLVFCYGFLTVVFANLILSFLQCNTATIIAGIIEFIPNQAKCNLGDCFSELSPLFVCLPQYVASSSSRLKISRLHTSKRSWVELTKRLDPVGISTLLSSIILLILGLTLGASYGWTCAGFLAPLILGALLLPIFFWWESTLPDEYAILPSSVWRIPNVAVLVVFALITLGWWAVNFIPFIELYHKVHGERMIIAAVRTLPEGIIAGIVSVLYITQPGLLAQPRYPIIIAMCLCVAAYAMWCQAPSLIGSDYWRYIFPGMIIGSGGMQVVLLSTNVGIMLAAPPERTGTVGAILQMSMQTSSVFALSIQAGLLTLHPGGLEDLRNVHASWYFEMGWTALWLVGFVIFYRPSKRA
ncbi:uncharacterized protein IL334_001482 [Kwoniella shivajii]|uniref:Major facilitator superfamily (MFS) profile domain-containing protein n=1 Tax=Kwoniella shivajii TaxID=564305 RepID=A0ABZ1CTL5_9TREE|nr:hypothetical protein IL334_001482 [Kwoniella shivajii]